MTNIPQKQKTFNMKDCPICETPNFQRKKFDLDEGSIYVCEGCGLGITVGPMPSTAGYHVEESNLLRKFKSLVLYYEFGYLGEMEALSLLEVGSGSGDLGSYLSSLGHVVTCSDVDRENVRDMRDCSKLRVIYYDVLGENMPKEKYDGVVLRHVFEHLDEPQLALDNLKKLLTDGGLLFITQPNFDSWSRLLLGKKWTWVLPDHRYHWNIKTLGRFLEKNGFVVIRSRGIFSPFGLPLGLGRMIKRPFLRKLLFPVTLGIGTVLEVLAIPFGGTNSFFIEAKYLGD